MMVSGGAKAQWLGYERNITDTDKRDEL